MAGVGILERSRKSVKRTMGVDFERNWQWQIRIESPHVKMPENLDLMARSINYGATEITLEAVKVGAIVFQQPTSAEPVVFTAVLRDTPEQEIGHWFDQLCGRVVNSDGTVNLPIDYIVEVTVYSVGLNEDTVTPVEKWRMIPQKRDSKDYNREGESFTETTIVLTQYSSTGI